MKHSEANNFAGKYITVFGANRSGIAVSKLLHELGARILLTDTRESNLLSNDILQLEGRSLQFCLGGHNETCIENAELIVVSPGVPLDIPILLEAERKNIPIVGELEVSTTLCQAPIVAITGTKGKSTTTLLTAAILDSSKIYRNVLPVGNIGIPLASNIPTMKKSDIAVVEASSFQLESTRNFHPNVSVVLNIERDHLDRHGTMDAYIAAKLKICQNQTDSDWIILNAADSTVTTFSHKTAARKALFVDKQEDLNELMSRFNTDVLAGVKTEKKDNYIFVRNDNKEHIICNINELPLVGSHNVRNVLAAVVVGSVLNVSPEKIREGLISFDCRHDALAHAFQKVSTINGVDYINDSKATNVIATYAALESIDCTASKKQVEKRVILIIGGYDKGNDYSSLIEPIKKKVKRLILLGEYTQHLQHVFTGCIEMSHASTMDQAVDYAYAYASPSDIVLLSPANASFDMYQDYKERGEAYVSKVNSLKIKKNKSTNDSFEFCYKAESGNSCRIKTH